MDEQHRVSLRDVERDARRAMSQDARDYILAGAMDERTLRANERAWQQWPLRPRVMTGAGEPDLTVRVFGRDWAHPVLAAPTARHDLLHEDAEVATARGLTAAATTMTVSSSASRPLDEIVAELDAWWFQVYLARNERLRRALVEQAVEAGAEALVLTVDLQASGRREAPLRAGRPLWPTEPTSSLWETVAATVGGSRTDGDHLEAVRPEHVTWLASYGRPVVVKGVLRGDDARRAVDAGAAGVQVSNHGGRQLDGAVTAADALGEVVEAVGDEVPVLVDGGIRRGTDVAVALARGATAVAVGKPVLWGLAVDGADGVRDTLGLLVDEVDHVMRLLGIDRLEDLSGDLLGRPGATP